MAMEGMVGVTSMDTRVAAVTVSVVVAILPPNEAQIVVVPTPVAVAKPCEPEALLMSAMLMSTEAQVVMAVTFCVELSV